MKLYSIGINSRIFIGVIQLYILSLVTFYHAEIHILFKLFRGINSKSYDCCKTSSRYILRVQINDI